MDILLLILAILCIVIGLIGSIVPALPGPPITYLGMWLAKWSHFVDFTSEQMTIWAVVVIAVTVIDYILPPLFTKKFGGSKKAVWGSTIGLVLGMILPVPVIGIILGPLIGAYIGEYINDHSDNARVWKVALGSFAAFIVGTGMKMVTSVWMGVLIIKGIF